MRILQNVVRTFAMFPHAITLIMRSTRNGYGLIVIRFQNQHNFGYDLSVSKYLFWHRKVIRFLHLNVLILWQIFSLALEFMAVKRRSATASIRTIQIQHGDNQ